MLFIWHKGACKIYYLYNRSINSTFALQSASFQNTQPSAVQYKTLIKPMSYCENWLLCRDGFRSNSCFSWMSYKVWNLSLMKGYRAYVCYQCSTPGKDPSFSFCRPAIIGHLLLFLFWSDSRALHQYGAWGINEKRKGGHPGCWHINIWP